jgi:two-component system cell cycle response regulator
LKFIADCGELRGMPGTGRDRIEHDDATQVIQAEPVVVARAQKEFLLLIHVGQGKEGQEGKEIGRRYDLEKESILIGRGPDNDIVLDLDTVSRRHARIDRKGGRTTLTDLQSTNGTYIDERRIPPYTPQELPRPARMMIGRAIFKYQAGDDLDLQYTEEIYQLKITDGLTGLPNRRRLMEVLAGEIPRARRYHRDLSLVMMDIDHFKRINDTLGHLAGDHVLRELANVVSMHVRQGEVFARYGGEEFVLVLPETSQEQAMQVAERLRQRVEACTFQFADRRIPVTVSLGVGVFSGDEMDERGLLEAADRNLYRAKDSGRNCVIG